MKRWFLFYKFRGADAVPWTKASVSMFRCVSMRMYSYACAHNRWPQFPKVWAFGVFLTSLNLSFSFSSYCLFLLHIQQLSTPPPPSHFPSYPLQKFSRSCPKKLVRLHSNRHRSLLSLHCKCAHHIYRLGSPWSASDLDLWSRSLGPFSLEVAKGTQRSRSNTNMCWYVHRSWLICNLCGRHLCGPRRILLNSNNFVLSRYYVYAFVIRTVQVYIHACLWVYVWVCVLCVFVRVCEYVCVSLSLSECFMFLSVCVVCTHI